MVTSSKGTVMGASRLVHHHLHLLHALVLEALAGDALRQGLDEVDGLALHDGHHLLGHNAVVHGLREIVGGRCRAGVQAEHQVDDEGLAFLALPGKHPVVASGLQPTQRDTIHANHSHWSTAPLAPLFVGFRAAAGAIRQHCPAVESTFEERQSSPTGAMDKTPSCC